MSEQLIQNQTQREAFAKPILQVNNKVNSIVKEMLQRHVGGKEFFENLDLSVRDHDIVQTLYDEIEKFNGYTYAIFISTGKFGIFFNNWINTFGNEGDKVYIVNGGLREGESITSLELFKRTIDGIPFVIVDDSYYSGRTNQVIKEHVESLGGTYMGTFVVYDGSLEKKDVIHSLYRYHESK